MSFDRTTLLEGPAIITFDNTTFYTEGAITYRPGISTFDIRTSVHGILDQRMDDIVGTVSFKPVGVWGHYETLLGPFASMHYGESLFGSTDKPLVIHSADGRRLTLNTACVSKIPAVTFSTAATLWGDVEFTVIGSKATEWSATGSRYSEAALEFNAPGLDPATILTQPYVVAFGSVAPWNSIESESGIHVGFDLQTTPIKTDSDGMVDLRLASLSAEVKFVPLGVTAAQYLDAFRLQGTGAARGASVGGAARSLTVTGSGVYFALNGAVAVDGSQVYDTAANRHGEITLRAVRSWANNALKPLFVVGTSAPQ